MSQNNLEQLIAGCRASDLTSQSKLYTMLYTEMMRVCFRYCTNEADAANLYNQAMLKVYNKIEQYNGQGSFNGWVKRVVINTCLDYCRSNTSYKNQTWLPEMQANQVKVAPTAHSNMEANSIMALVQQLPKNTAAVFNLYAIDGYKHGEIAQLLGISEGTSKWHLNEARKQLKIKLENLL